MSPTYHEVSDTPEPKRNGARKILVILLWVVGIAITVGVCLSVIYVYMNF
jgi:hypothetical protein